MNDMSEEETMMKDLPHHKELKELVQSAKEKAQECHIATGEIDYLNFVIELEEIHEELELMDDMEFKKVVDKVLDENKELLERLS